MTTTPPAAKRDQVNILMVDDQPAKLLSYETILEDLGENLIRANSGNEALELLLKMDIAVVLVDVCMPELDGFELASMIRNHPRFRKTAIILVSGVMVEDSDRLKGYDSGAVDYVSVPIIPEILRAKVSVFAELFRKTQALQRWNEELEARVAERTREIEGAAARLRHSEERLRLVLSQSGMRGWSWDIARDEVFSVDPSGAQTTVGSLEAFLASVIEEDRAAVRDALQRTADAAREHEVEFRAKEGETERWLLGRSTVIRDASGKAISVAGLHIDITDRKRAEEERAQLLKNADVARREAETANRMKDDFLATLSHELRTPLNAITGWSHMLREGMLDEAGRARAAEAIERNAHRQSKLIADILDVSRIVAGKLTLHREIVDMRTVVEAAVDTVRPAADDRLIHIDTRLDADVRVNGDPARLQQVVWNLLSNALKFSPEKASVLVELRNAGDHIELSVQDEGPGISPQLLPFVFDRFRQGDASTTRSHSGLGLGLAIVRQLLTMHDGTVEAHNRTDAPGARFTVSLPIATAAPAAARDAAEAAPGGRPRLAGIYVLVVDDDADGRDVVGSGLMHYGAEVSTAESVAEAMKLIERRPPTVLVADIEMPVEDGYALVRKLRALPPEAGGDIPAIALTAHAAGRDRTRVLGAGFNVHQPKPVQLADLADLIARLAAGEEPPASP